MLSHNNLLNLLLFLLLCLVHCSKTPPVPVTGIKGRDVTLPYTFKDRKIFRITLKHSSNKPDTLCDNNKCHDQRTSGIILKNLSSSDDGKYTLDVYYDDGRIELDPETAEYQLQINESNEKLDKTIDIKSNDTGHGHWGLITAVGFLLVLIPIIITAVRKKDATSASVN